MPDFVTPQLLVYIGIITVVFFGLQIGAAGAAILGIVLFAEPGKRISHVAIYAGRRRIIHASGSGRRVRYDALDTKRGRWFARRLVSARRVTTGGKALVNELLAQHVGAIGSQALQLDPPDTAPTP